MPFEIAVGVPLHVLPGQYFEKSTSPSLHLGACDNVSFLASFLLVGMVTYSDIIEQKFSFVYSLERMFYGSLVQGTLMQNS